MAKKGWKGAKHGRKSNVCTKSSPKPTPDTSPISKATGSDKK